jgi:hypothetical protein
MNTVNAVVTKVTSSPQIEFNKWWVDVECNSHGKIFNTRLMFETKEEAEKVDVGYKFDT